MKRTTYAIAVISLAIMACGMTLPVTTIPAAMSAPVPVRGVNKDAQINTTAQTMEITICGRWNIRPAAGDLDGHLGWIEDGKVATVLLPTTVTEDMGLWYELSAGGWVNARAICR